MLLDLVGIASEGEKVSTNSEGIIEVGGAKGVENMRSLKSAKMSQFAKRTRRTLVRRDAPNSAWMPDLTLPLHCALLPPRCRACVGRNWA